MDDGSVLTLWALMTSFTCRLVDSRDIIELQLKQNDCELIIRKKEALPQPPASAPVVMMQSPAPLPPQYASPHPSGSLAPAPRSPKPATPAAKAPTFSHPPLKCPMAGTFYRSPAPGEPPFVKVILELLDLVHLIMHRWAELG